MVGKEKQFIISVIIPVFNTEKYLERTINSIINQTLAFKDNIQIILINDGSTDNSNVICEKYAREYKENIIYYDFGYNCGVSTARNKGKELASGKYINFLDSDDLWSEDAFKEAIEFLETNDDTIDFIAVNISFFEAVEGEHILNIPLQTSQVIDVSERYDEIRTNVVACIFKREAINDIWFDPRQAYWEDAKFLSIVLLKKMKYGMLSNARYYYRKRIENSSATQNYKNNMLHYIDDIKIFFEDIQKYSNKLCGELPNVMQVLVAYILAYRFSDNYDIPGDKLQEYLQMIKYMLEMLNDKNILLSKNAPKYVKLDMLSCKYARDVRSELICRNNAFYFGDNKVFDLAEGILSIWHVRSEKNFFIEGRFGLDVDKKYLLYAIDEMGREYDITILEWLGRIVRKTFQKKSWMIYGYVVSVPLDVEELQFILEIDGEKHIMPFKCFDINTNKSYYEGTSFCPSKWIERFMYKNLEKK